MVTIVFLFFPPFPFFSFFRPFVFGESKTAPVRVAEKVMDRALNVGSHGIWDVGDRCVAPIGSHRPPPRRANGRRGRRRGVEGAFSNGRGTKLLRQLCVRCVQRAREETLEQEGTFDPSARAIYRQPSSRGKVKVRVNRLDLSVLPSFLPSSSFEFS